MKTLEQKRRESSRKQEGLDPETRHRRLFGQELAKSRLARGYQTAYAFFHRRGGRKSFGFSYKHYLMIEAGKRLPSREGLRQLLSALASDDGEGFRIRRHLLVLYLKALVGGDELFEPAFDAREPATPSHEKPLLPLDWRDQMLDQAAATQVAAIPRMSIEQSEAFHSSKDCFWVLTLLLRSARPWARPELAKRLGLREDKIASALETLARVKLVAQDEQGRAFTPHAATDLWSGGLPGKMVEVAQKKFQWLDERVDTTNEFYLHPYLLMTVPKAERDEKLRILSELVRDAMRKAYLFNPRRPVEDGVLCLIQSRIALLDFEP